MWALASGVAAIAAIVSYSHIYDLGRAHGGSGVSARLLPLSVDMLILVGELMLLHEADAKGKRFALGWVLVWSGILATLAANVTYGAQFGVLGALIWGWPAYSFILAAGGMVAIVKRGAARQGTDAVALPSPPAAEVHPVSAPAPARRMQSRSGRSRSRNTVSDADSEMHFAAELAAGQAPSARRIQRELHVGQKRANALREQMQSIVDSRTEPVP
jgi:hypothetical protein